MTYKNSDMISFIMLGFLALVVAGSTLGIAMQYAIQEGFIDKTVIVAFVVTATFYLAMKASR